jgi:integrase
MKPIFTIPKLVKPKNTKYGWYMYYRYEGKKITNMFSLNSIDDLVEREYRFNEACREVHNRLREGFNPLAPVVDLESKEESEISELLLISGLLWALEKRKKYLDPKTYNTYKGTVNFLEEAIKGTYLNSLKVVDCKRTQLMLVLEKASIKESWTDKTFNKCLGHLKILMTVLVKWGILEANYATGIENIKVAKDSSVNKPGSDSEIERIKNHLINKDFRFYVFSITVFHTGIRMKELLLVNLGMVDLNKDEFNLPGKTIKNGKEIRLTKNGNARVVPINKYLKEYLIKMDFSHLPKDYYLFGSAKESGMGNRGKNQVLPDFLPGPTHVSRDTSGRRWKKLVKDDLGITMNLYAMKHHGADKKILAGMDLDSLRELYGHSSKVTTKIYAQKINEVYRKDIMDNSPDF